MGQEQPSSAAEITTLKIKVPNNKVCETDIISETYITGPNHAR